MQQMQQDAGTFTAPVSLFCPCFPFSFSLSRPCVLSTNHRPLPHVFHAAPPPPSRRPLCILPDVRARHTHAHTFSVCILHPSHVLSIRGTPFSHRAFRSFSALAWSLFLASTVLLMFFIPSVSRLLHVSKNKLQKRRLGLLH